MAGFRKPIGKAEVGKNTLTVLEPCNGFSFRRWIIELKMATCANMNVENKKAVMENIAK